MNHFIAEGIVFAAFLGVACAAHAVRHLSERHRTRIARHTSRFLILVSAAAGHPATGDALHEYVVHLLVYSGYVLKAH